MPILAAVGGLIVVAVLFDVVWTTVAVGGGRGVLANGIATAVAGLGRLGNPSHRRLQITGVVVAVAVPATRLLAVWAGFSFVFLADEQAVVDSAIWRSTAEPRAPMWNRRAGSWHEVASAP